MSRRGDCWGNAVAESFFGTSTNRQPAVLAGEDRSTPTSAVHASGPTLKANLADHEQYTSRPASRVSTAEYIDSYNVQRRHSVLNYVSPVELD
jgi:transposase InsO family protein